MRLDIRTKLVLVSLGLIATSIFVLEAYLRPLIEQEILDGLRADLLGRLVLIERDLETMADRVPGPNWDALAHDFGERAGLRVTFIRPDGVVMGDSDIEARALPMSARVN